VICGENVGSIIIIIQELVIDLAIVTSSRHADRSTCARRFAITKPKFADRFRCSMSGSSGPANPPSPVFRRAQNASLESPVMILPGVTAAEMTEEGKMTTTHGVRQGWLFITISMYPKFPNVQLYVHTEK